MRKRDLNEFDVLEVEMGYVTPCHIPLSARGTPFKLCQDGYSVVTRTIEGLKVFMRAHKLRFEAVNGPVPVGMVPDHLCKHRPCCNPAHMEAVTIAVNNRRGFRTKLTNEQVLQMRALRAGGTSNKQVAEKFGISEGHCSHVTRGEYWAEGLSPAWNRVKRRRLKA